MGMTTIDIIGYGCILYILALLFRIIYYTIGLYELNPFLKLNPLTQQEKFLIENKIHIVTGLTEKERKKFYKRVLWFKSRTFFL